MSNLVRKFEGQEVKVKTDKGQTLINLAHTAKVCGLVNKTRGFESVRWSQVKERLNIVKKGIGKDMPTQYLSEINYILEEIENTDDRNSIYMSSWLSKRLALECHSEKANRYKNFLVSLDESRECGQAIPNNEAIQILNNSLPMLEQVVTLLVPAMNEVKGQVNSMVSLMHDQSVIYDQDREDLKSLIGLRAVNTKRLSDKLKEELSENLGMAITANGSHYRKAKEKIFKQFKVIKWEDIPAVKYNAVYAYIEEIAN